MRRIAIALENETLVAAHYDPETAGCEIVDFDEDAHHIGMHFRMNAGTPEWVDADEATLHLHAGLDDGLTTRGHQETGVSIEIEDLLAVVLKRVKSAVADVDVVVFFDNASDPAVFRAAARRAGFKDIRFIDPVDAVIRHFQWSTPELATDARDVVCLTFQTNGLTWDRRIAARDGTFILPDAPTTANGGCADNGDLEIFFHWWKNIGGSRYLVISGADKTTLPPGVVSTLEHHFEVFYATNPLIGAAYPRYPSFHTQFDEAVADAIAAVKTTDFQTAVAKYEIAKGLFSDPPSDLEQLRVRIREELLKAATHADLDSVDTYFEWAIGLSENLNEKAAVHAESANFYQKSGDKQRAEDEMLFASYMDPETYAESRSQETSDTTTSETPPNGTRRDSVPWVTLGVGLWLWWMSRPLL